MDWREVHDHMEAGDADALLHRQAGRCMDCGIPYCHSGCPLGNLIPEWNDLVWKGQWAEASDRLHATNNFPEFTGRICPAPCETSCVLGINQPPVTIKQVEMSIADTAFDRDLVAPQLPYFLTGHTVAVVGSGPAGLAAAQQLTRAGHTVAVFERADRIGGLLRYGVPDFKLEKHLIDRRIAQMEAEGTRFRPGVEIGKDITWTELRARYDAVLIAIGSTTPRLLAVPGSHLTGVHPAVPFLRQSNQVQAGDVVADQVTATGKHVVVIGGGDTGSDCVGTSLRQGAASVTSLEITPQPPVDRPANQPWPTHPMVYKVSSSHEEGGERAYLASTVELLGDEDGNVRHLRVATTELSPDGRLLPVPGTEKDLPADLVLLAMGFTGPETDTLVAQTGADLTGQGWVARGDDFATSVPGVFVAGDAGRGQSLVVWAIAEGRAAAAGIDAYLRGSTELPALVGPTTRAMRA
jgi:glutamate synthase (NADPH/NADH) small chain